MPDSVPGGAVVAGPEEVTLVEFPEGAVTEGEAALLDSDAMVDPEGMAVDSGAAVLDSGAAVLDSGAAVLDSGAAVLDLDASVDGEADSEAPEGEGVALSPQDEAALLTLLP